MQATRTAPIFRIFDVAKAKEFYVDFLGFAVDWEHRFDAAAPLYMQVSRGGLVLHLSEHHGDCCPGSTAFVTVTGLEAFHAEITAKGYGHLRPGLEPTFHKSLGLQLTDPFGNRLRLDQPDAAA
jgi:catechol 2,3-dioxygenase-like lactoylglutathione lyase family enzyme